MSFIHLNAGCNQAWDCVDTSKDQQTELQQTNNGNCGKARGRSVYWGNVGTLLNVRTKWKDLERLRPAVMPYLAY